MMKLNGKYGNRNAGFEAGMTLIESMVTLAIVAAIAVVFLSGIIVTSKASIITDEQSTAESLARAQMEWVQQSDYTENATQYTPAAILDINDYQSYSTQIAAESLHTPDDGIQKIKVTVFRDSETLMTLEGYKRR